MDNKEEEINKRIAMLRKKNELLEQRHKEVLADKQSAEKSTPRRHVAPTTEKRNPDNQKSPYSRAHMDQPDEDDDQRNYRRNRRSPYRGRGQTNVNPHSVRSRGGGRPSQDYEAKRLENFRLMEEEFAQKPEQSEGEISPGVSKFLDDPRRKGDLDPDSRWKSSRHKGSFGGLDFQNVKYASRGRGREYRGGGRGRGMTKLQMTAEYTGRERQDQERWQAMREEADRQISAKAKNAEGVWRREWDCEKDSQSKSDQDFRYSEPRPRGRGRRGGRGYRHGQNDQFVQGDRGKPAADTKMEVPPQAAEQTATPNATKRSGAKDARSPMHLLQQRAQTPSSKDGTEVWAQNSHHSDEVGGDWKNGGNTSGDQWLPSVEGNRNPAIDERLLEQQDDGATDYSQHLGRGWGSEKNIKATKAWVIDTEKAGVPKTKPDGDPNKHDPVDSVKSQTALRATRSASPRLKQKSAGLTVEINKEGGRQVKSKKSTADQSPANVKDTASDGNVADAEKPVPADPVPSPDFLKTPEDMKYVTDWAAEVDMQSPTYEVRQLQLQNDTGVQEPSQTVEKSAEVSVTTEAVIDNTDPTDSRVDEEVIQHSNQTETADEEGSACQSAQIVEKPAAVTVTTKPVTDNTDPPSSAHDMAVEHSEQATTGDSELPKPVSLGSKVVDVIPKTDSDSAGLADCNDISTKDETDGDVAKTNISDEITGVSRTAVESEEITGNDAELPKSIEGQSEEKSSLPEDGNDEFFECEENKTDDVQTLQSGPDTAAVADFAVSPANDEDSLAEKQSENEVMPGNNDGENFDKKRSVNEGIPASNDADLDNSVEKHSAE